MNQREQYMKRVIDRLTQDNVLLKQCIAHQNAVMDLQASVSNAFAFDLARLELGSLPERLIRDWDEALKQCQGAAK